MTAPSETGNKANVIIKNNSLKTDENQLSGKTPEDMIGNKLRLKNEL